MNFLIDIVQFFEEASVFLVKNWPITVPLILGLAAVYLLLPRPWSYPSIWGAAAAGSALLTAGWLLIWGKTAHPETVLFYAFSGLAVVSGGLLITQRNPVHGALSFALVVLSTCGLFLLQAAPFLMAATIIVYAGAIVVTFLFVIMLAQQAGLSDADRRSREPLFSSVAGFILLGAVLYLLQLTYDTRGLTELLVRTARSAEQVEGLLQRAGAEAGSLSSEKVESTLAGMNLDSLLAGFEQETRKHFDAADGLRLATAKEKAQLSWNDVQVELQMKPELGKTGRQRLEDLKQALVDLKVVGEGYRNRYGNLQPRSGKAEEFSSWSGPPANRPLEQLPRDGQGRVNMPAENVAALGTALFSDFLIPVELGGTLLLVATIGAIAISGRRPEGLR
jgi:NADH-quinone oxidoreductase subunit J